MPRDEATGARTFSYDEARALLPRVRSLTDEACRQVESLGRSTADPAQLQEQGDRIVSDWARSVRELGAEVKGLWLVDFDNGSGYYCWRYPEDGLHYYHSYEDGFRGRVRIQ